MGRRQSDGTWDLGTSVVAPATYVAPARAEVSRRGERASAARVVLSGGSS